MRKFQVSSSIPTFSEARTGIQHIPKAPPIVVSSPNGPQFISPVLAARTEADLLQRERLFKTPGASYRSRG